MVFDYVSFNVYLTMIIVKIKKESLRKPQEVKMPVEFASYDI